MNENTQTDLNPMTGLDKTDSNPLSQYFRHAKIQIELPTGGEFWPDGSLNLNEDKSLAILPMTAKDGAQLPIWLLRWLFQPTKRSRNFPASRFHQVRPGARQQSAVCQPFPAARP